MTKEQKKRIIEAKRAWEDAQTQRDRAEEDQTRCSKDVEEAHYDFEQWGFAEKYNASEMKLEEAEALVNKTHRELRDALEEAGLLKP